MPMQILIDECLPKKLKRELVEYTVFTVQEKGWAGMKNGELLRRAEKEFDVWVTADQNIAHQQDIKRFDIAIIVLVAPRNQLNFLLPLTPQLHKVLQTIQPGQIIYIDSHLTLDFLLPWRSGDTAKVGVRKSLLQEK